MQEKSLGNKDISIQNIVKKVLDCFGHNFFESYTTDSRSEIIDFWDSDLFAIGLKLKDRIVYISTWDYRNNSLQEMQYYVAFELVDIESLETIQLVNEFNGIDSISLIREMKVFLT
ncbi:MAG: hypothetical protein RL660_1583 [Bacteroidota bacterium]|jgi:hypothetical protein